MLSITARLTLLVSALSAVVLVPLCVVIATMVEATLRREGERLAELEARAARSRAVSRWDEDLLVEFGPPPPLAEQLRDDGEAWAIGRAFEDPWFRASGFPETLTGHIAPEPRVVTQDGRSYRVLSVALFPVEEGATSLPDSIAAMALGRDGDRAVLRVTTEWVEPGDVEYEIVSVDGRRLYVTEVTKTASGELEDAETRPIELPSSVPPEFIEQRLGGLRGCSCDRVTWKGQYGQLLLVWNGEDSDGNACARAVNRLGEEYAVREDGAVGEPVAKTQLFATIASPMDDEQREAARARFVVAGAGVVAWLALSLVGWLVARVSMRPIRQIVTRVDAIGDRLEQRIPVGEARDEVAEIQGRVNSMLDRIEEGVHRERRFLSDASHELRSPLARMRGELDLATGRERPAEELATVVERCARYVQSMQLTVESLLTLARIDAGRRVVRREPFDLTSTAMQVVHGFPRDAASRVAFHVEQGTGPCVVDADEALVKICIRNLLDNALRYSPAQSPVTLRIAQNGTSTVLDIVDRGAGIPHDLEKRVFDRFMRGDASRTHKEGGTGIGLSIVRAICDASEIAIELDSSERGETTARLRIPSKRGSA